MGCKGAGQKKAAEHTADQCQKPENPGVTAERSINLLCFWSFSPDITAKPGIARSGAIYGLPGSEEIAEASVFEEAALISHVHSLMKQNPVAVQLYSQIAQLSPGHHQQTEVHTAAGKPHLKITGTDTVRRRGARFPVQPSRKHGQQKIQGSQYGKAQYHQIHHAHNSGGDGQLREHFICDRQDHG